MTLPASIFAPPLPYTAENRIVWTGLGPGADALAITSAARAHPGLLLVVTRDTSEAARLEAELSFFLSGPDAPVLLHFPDWETLPYDNFSPSPDIISRRIETLQQLPALHRGLLVAPITTLMHRVPPADWLSGRSLILDVGTKFDLHMRRKALEVAGYRRVETVMEHGEYVVRGELMDIFPIGSDLPYRIDLFDDEIETLRTFDPETQRTINTVESVRLLPAKEFPLDKTAIRTFQDRWHMQFNVNARSCPVYQDVSVGSVPPGIEYYLPLFFDHLSVLTDYLPDNTCVLLCGDISNDARLFRKEVVERYENLHWDPERPILPPDDLFLTVDELFTSLSRFAQVRLRSEASGARESDFSFQVSSLPATQVNPRAEIPAAHLAHWLAGNEPSTPAPERVLFLAESPGRRALLLETLQRAGLQPALTENLHGFLTTDASQGLAIAPLDAGFLISTPEHQTLALIPETALVGERVRQTRGRTQSQESADAIVRGLSELSTGAPVVHIDYGVGRYLGLEIIDLDDRVGEFLTLEYAGGARLYVPVASLHLISRYTGADETAAPLHKLGSDQWEKAKRKAAEKIHDVAAELLDTHARRAARPGIIFDRPDANYHAFANEFPFEETLDQQQSIDAVITDMTGPGAMDRLVCGDVGFGKTEVAMRAAFIAVGSHKQVVVLVPTTLLAQQHLETFSDRFADWPVQIEALSRFNSRKKVASIAERLQHGHIDILIGTHKLLGSTLLYKNLGLVIIDEEHRFGVRQKEQLKSLRSEVDILTLTATPIPRTLNLSLHGLSDLSIIAEPPAQRLAIRTFVRQKSQGLVKEAILRELLRGGQVFYVHNEVRTIERTAEELAELVPEARITVGHGQMRERALEQVMSDFHHRRTNLLVCSTIIETGIDIPNANTIVIDRADRFGLAQLHQLRGRVGRSQRQAYAYLLTPHPQAMTDNARKRLEAIEAADTLGAGFQLATHDLEIRGTGELLGEEQSGQMQTIGFSFYMEMLDRTVQALRAGKTLNLDQPLAAGVEVDLHLPALIPDDYLPDVHMRLVLYKRIANCTAPEALDTLRAEMVDRFGLLPEPVRHLFKITALKLQAEQLGLTRVDASDTGGRIEFGPETRVDSLALVNFVQQHPELYQLESGTRLRFRIPMAEKEQRLAMVAELLTNLSPGEDNQEHRSTCG